jgi:hypothetical protein
MRCETLSLLDRYRLLSPSAERNKAPIAAILSQVLPAGGVVLEVSSGTGQHVIHFAKEMPHLIWQPSEREDDLLRSIEHWRTAEALANVRAPVRLDVMEWPWPVASAAAAVCLNMIHIAPWAAAEALIAGASKVADKGGTLFLYGPFRRGDRHTTPSNEAFDLQLRSQNPDWGVRDLEEVSAFAKARGFGPPAIHEMPANNLSVVFRKA